MTSDESQQPQPLFRYPREKGLHYRRIERFDEGGVPSTAASILKAAPCYRFITVD